MTVEGSTICDAPWSGSNTCLPTCACTPVHTSRALMTKSTFPHPPVCLAGVARQQAAWTPHLTCRTSEQPAVTAPSCTPLSTKHALSIQSVEAKVNVFISGHFYRGVTMKISALASGKSQWNINMYYLNVCLEPGFITKINWINRIYQQNWTGRKKINIYTCAFVAAPEHRGLRRIT